MNDERQGNEEMKRKRYASDGREESEDDSLGRERERDFRGVRLSLEKMKQLNERDLEKLMRVPFIQKNLLPIL